MQVEAATNLPAMPAPVPDTGAGTSSEGAEEPGSRRSGRERRPAGQVEQEEAAQEAAPTKAGGKAAAKGAGNRPRRS